MSAEPSAEAPAHAAAHWPDTIAIIICTLAWGTTWFAITLQFGVVDPVVSIVYRFGLASALLFAWCMAQRERIALSLEQHANALGLGLFNFTLNYSLVYWAEERVTSAVVAVSFAALSFVNLAMFRVVFGQRANALAWGAALLGVSGVALMSWQEIARTDMSARTIAGIVLALVAVLAASAANLWAKRAESLKTPVAPLMAWAMFYGTLCLVLYALATGKRWAFEPSLEYIGSLLHLSIVGSVVAFVLYYGLARRRGYTLASYISALTPPVAMLVSTVFENKSWGALALVGVALVLLGQVVLLRGKRSA